MGTLKEIVLGFILGMIAVRADNPFGEAITAFGERYVDNCPIPIFHNFPFFWGAAIAIIVIAIVVSILKGLWAAFWKRNQKYKKRLDNVILPLIILLAILVAPEVGKLPVGLSHLSPPSTATAISQEEEVKKAVARYWELINAGSFRSAWYKTTDAYQEKHPFDDGASFANWQHVEVSFGNVRIGKNTAEVETTLTIYAGGTEVRTVLFCMAHTDIGWLIDYVNNETPCTLY
jgi:hypothetical protein